MSASDYPDDVQFVGLVKAATAAADAQQRSATLTGKRKRDQDDFPDHDPRIRPSNPAEAVDSARPDTPTLQSSAAVLFREPSEKSRKYSRPPLGKVYSSLELAPESFLRLQNAAKAFMLDEDHAERRDVVGHKKHSNNNDVAKLKLWTCVEQFLNTDNNGDRYFGHSAGAGIPDSPQRTFFWPEDGHKIIRLCMPLCRKMVTNERQRIYAAETRKQDSTNDEKKTLSTAAGRDIEGHLDARIASLEDGAPDDANFEVPTKSQHTSGAEPEAPHAVPVTGTLVLHVNIISHESSSARRMRPRFSIPSEAATNLTSLFNEVQKYYDLSQRRVESADSALMPSVKVWLPDGLVPVREDGEWMVALLSAGMVEWMDGEVRVLIEV